MLKAAKVIKIVVLIAVCMSSIQSVFSTFRAVYKSLGKLL